MLLTQLITLALSFVSRTVFIKTLGAEYLGLNGLFLNVLNALSLAEMGIGTAIAYALYKPIAENDT
jgi:O-antigen/teichoic acid export membrane protein